MTIKYMQNDAYVTADSAISSDDIEKLANISDENAQREAVIALYKKFNLTYNESDTIDAQITALQAEATCEITSKEDEPVVSI